LLARPLPPKPLLKNIVAEALRVKAFLNEDLKEPTSTPA